MIQTTRRTILGSLAAASCGAATARARPRPPFPIGVQLWTVKDDLDRDFDGTLQQLAAIGYRRVETAGLHGRTPQAFAAGLHRAGLACDSVHVSMPDLRKDQGGWIAQAQALGAKYLVCSSPEPSQPPPPGDWIAGMGKVMRLDDWRRNAEWLNRAGEAATKNGLSFAYHNHPFDMATYDGVVAYDELVRSTDPRWVGFELDVGWAVAGGRDPLALMRRYAGRIRLLHLKDLQARPAAGAAAVTVPLGQGVIGWREVLRTARAVGVREAFVEQEPPFTPPPLQALAQSYRYLQTLGAEPAHG
jgi:sugar phosphate isomerase/epimerase